MATFPLPFVPRLSYHTGGRRFGARRDGGRMHAACDLIAPEGTEIFAVDSGVVIGGPYEFYHGTFAIEVRHPRFIVRYCEIRGAASGIRVGSNVLQGQVIAYVGRMYVDSMLHFEMYDGSGRGGLTQRGNPPYQRRSDLIDPTSFLDQMQPNLLMCVP
jgi:murein DD-endopeptidase MepM/ murein hydrolase activator NlpD